MRRQQLPGVAGVFRGERQERRLAAGAVIDGSEGRRDPVEAQMRPLELPELGALGPVDGAAAVRVRPRRVRVFGPRRDVVQLLADVDGGAVRAADDDG